MFLAIFAPQLPKKTVKIKKGGSLEILAIGKNSIDENRTDCFLLFKTI
jgi:hypothetical protein